MLAAMHFGNVSAGASRLILKGGIAMRALYGTTRLTKDVDFDCEGADAVLADQIR
jgi:hypothetical protein